MFKPSCCLPHGVSNPMEAVRMRGSLRATRHEWRDGWECTRFWVMRPSRRSTCRRARKSGSSSRHSCLNGGPGYAGLGERASHPYHPRRQLTGTNPDSTTSYRLDLADPNRLTLSPSKKTHSSRSACINPYLALVLRRRFRSTVISTLREWSRLRRSVKS